MITDLNKIAEDVCEKLEISLVEYDLKVSGSSVEFVIKGVWEGEVIWNGNED